MSNESQLASYQPEDFFFLRSPLLPFEELERLLEEEQAAGGDPEKVHAALLRLAARPEIAEALYVASPELIAGLERQNEKPEPKKAERLRQTLTRYLLRLMTRPTPFGLFAGGTLGRLGERTELSLAALSSYGRHTRLDMDYLDLLARDLERDPGLRRELIYRPNSSLYRAAGRLRYAEGRLVGANRAYHLVALRPDVFLEAALCAAAGGARLVDIAQAIVDADPEAGIELEEAEAFAHELIDTQLLVSDLGPKITGEEPIHGLIGRLSTIAQAAPFVARLEATRDALAALDASPPGAAAEVYRELAKGLEALGSKVALPRLFQVDMTKKAQSLTLGPEVIAELERAITFLYRLRADASGDARADAFSSFREDFLRRYEPGQLVPLAPLLDEEIGIGFQRSAAIGTEASPLLQGIAFPARPGLAQISWNPAQELLLRKTFEALRRGDGPVVWTDADLASLETTSRTDTPTAAPIEDFYTAFQTIFSLTASSAEAVDRGEFQLHLKGASGASGATLLGRFCHGDPELEEELAGHLRREESEDPEAVFAEIVHLPEGRIGNILLRPQLRDYEIPFLGQGGADAEHQLPVSDLLVTVRGDRVLLFSQRLGKRVIPRLSSAHNYSLRGLGVYRFLCALQHHGMRSGLFFPWGPLENLPYLPRVVYGRTILAPARWRVEKSELPPLGALDAWRQERNIPQRVLLADGDNELFVDFKSPLLVEAFLAIVRKRAGFSLVEFSHGPEGLLVSGPEGHFTHEIVLPYVRQAAPKPSAGQTRRPMTPQAQLPPLLHPPGSSWIYAKLYTGTATADGILEDLAGTLTRRFGQEISSFFFLRFTDPDFHLRLRFEVQSEAARQEVLRQLTALASDLLGQGRIWDLRFDSYRPEVDRYGGLEGLNQCERLFHADSVAALALLPHLQGDAGAQVRWLVALCSVDGLVRSLLGDDSPAYEACLEAMARGFANEFRFDKTTRVSINARLRGEADLLEAALERRVEPGSNLDLALQSLDTRRRATEEPIARLRFLESQGKLSTPLSAVTASLAHMSVNRLIAAEARAHEAVIYEVLHRHLLSRQARRRGRAKPMPVPVEQPVET